MWCRLTPEVAVSANPKCGCMSLKQFGPLRLSCEDVAGCATRVLFLREPMRRLYSAYCYFCMVRDAGGLYMPVGKGRPHSYEAFVDLTFELRDRHWDPQVNNCRSYTEVRDWAGLTSYVSEVTGQPLQHVNQSPPYPADLCYRADELAERYCEDYALMGAL